MRNEIDYEVEQNRPDEDFGGYGGNSPYEVTDNTSIVTIIAAVAVIVLLVILLVLTL